ncbi:MAG: RHS repeat-associated core domain-containing protein, partial [Phycisphaerales bacterium]|nr:RHS repeat-associated core domain-containing protein [Phycisphaerales bacterium]
PESTQSQITKTHNGLVQETITQTGLTYKYIYDAIGRRIKTNDPRTGESLVHYNAKGQVDWIRDAALKFTSFAYDANSGRRTSVTNPGGKKTYYAYDNAAFGQLHRIWGHVPQPVEFEYNTTYGHLFKMRTYRSGDFTQSTWPSQPPTPDETRWDRDGVSGLLTRKVYPDTTQVKYVYNDYSALKSRDWARGPISIVGETSYTYDPDTGQLTNIDYTDATPDIALTYDRLGRIATVTDALGTHTFTYNAKLQLESEEIAGSIYDATITRQYDDDTVNGVPGRYDGFGIGMDTGNWNDDFQATYLFDTHGRLNHVGGTALPDSGVDYTFLLNSDLIEKIQYKANSVTFAETVRNYESTRDLLTSVENKWGTTVISKYDYAYDNLRRRTSVVNKEKAFDDHSQVALSLYTYNDRNELTRSKRHQGTDPQQPGPAVIGQDFEYAYDPIGNRDTSSIDGGTATDYTTNNVNQYTATANPAETFTYDADGNMTADDDLTYTYDMENRLISVADSQGTILEFTYDYRGRRVRKVEHDPDPVNGGVIEDTRFVYDGWNVVLELDGQDNNAILRKYAWGLDLSTSIQGAGGIGGLLAVEDTDGTVATNDDTPYLYLYDGNGNVGQLMDFSDTQTLAIAAHYEYDPYGKAIVSTGSYAGDNPFRFSTKYWDDESEFYYYGYRYYSPQLGRWLNRDPIEEAGGNNLVEFVWGNPINLIDVLGREPVIFVNGKPPGTPPSTDIASRLCDVSQGWEVNQEVNTEDDVDGDWVWVAEVHDPITLPLVPVSDYIAHKYLQGNITWEHVGESVHVGCCLKGKPASGSLSVTFSQSTSFTKSGGGGFTLYGVAQFSGQVSITKGESMGITFSFNWGPYGPNNTEEYLIFLVGERLTVQRQDIARSRGKNAKITANDIGAKPYKSGVEATGYTGKVGLVICKRACSKKKAGQ